MKIPTAKEIKAFENYVKAIKLKIALLFPERDIEEKIKIKK